MKIIIYSDNHFSEYSSIFRSKNAGSRISNRLLNQIQTLNWIESYAEQNGCEMIICAGDFFDKPTLNSVEITALRSIEWSNKQHYFLVGNHEMGTSDLFFNSTNALNAPNMSVISKACSIDVGGTELCFFPYRLDSSEISLYDEFGVKANKRVIISHNDIAGIQMGAFISKDGLKIDDIKSNCDLFINGHLHNCSEFAPNCYNIGNITGQNFSEDGFIYKHYAVCIDTDTLSVEFIENPYAVYFYKISVPSNLHDMYTVFDSISTNSVLTVKCDYGNVSAVREYIENLINKGKNIYDYRIISINNNSDIETNTAISIESIDHIQKFKTAFIEKYGSNDIILSELQEVSL